MATATSCRWSKRSRTKAICWSSLRAHPWTSCANACTHVHMARVANRIAVTARLSPEVLAALERVSVSDGEPVSRTINRLLRIKLEELGALQKKPVVSDQ